MYIEQIKHINSDNDTRKNKNMPTYTIDRTKISAIAMHFSATNGPSMTESPKFPS